MASIHRRGDKWRLYWRDATGCQHAESFDRQRDAQKRRWEIEPLEKQRLQPKIDPNISIPEYAKRWLTLAAAKLEPSTIESYAGTLRCYICGLEKDTDDSPLKAAKDGPLVDMQVRNLRRSHVMELLARIMSTPSQRRAKLSVETVRRVHATLRAMLDWAVVDELLLENPASGVAKRLKLTRSKRQRQEEKSPLTAEERDLFHATCLKDDVRMHPFFFVLERAGLRLGEAIELRLNDVNIKRREIRVARSLCRVKRAAKAPKSGHGRTVEMSTDLAGVLEEVVARRRREGLAEGDTNPLLFPSEAGTPYWHRNVERRFGRVLKKAGLPSHHTPHDLRHTYATLLLERGVDVQWLQAQMGHASIQTTVDEYGKWMKPRKGLADRLDLPAASELTSSSDRGTRCHGGGGGEG